MRFPPEPEQFAGRAQAMASTSAALAPAMPAEPVTASVHINAPPERVYEYLTRSEAIVSWMGEYALLEAEPGGRFHLAGLDLPAFAEAMSGIAAAEMGPLIRRTTPASPG
jgi:hypothetical protein